ncbi:MULTISPECIES: precorrin-2 dehydrogenase/sirohydrochlorin ferrochelatase family protein [unclassified Sphingomonas]|uniref:precorrin-2 dehydrogenase/sirohydrochlorin ferrochelatase family protein n=1 Tax=unclassified Sphingomonas TaxID=196159 RepID=UPI0007014CD5|nr:MULTISPECIES: bifunctional precorrin-2 dehydrogenase/sirohydrochlorin ferrochelatase [unclassified Sphingomonas]KQM61771.1 siroheme synthase [Sphingomonas sp. Leaf16]KQN13045.1 siroheme synthase [Sphingomonas sp. Leaf29]KQN19930.1 siroheme synthase [Sphingomonas sp. Leaf32]
MNGLPILLRTAGRRVILVGEGEAADAKRRLLERSGLTVVADADDARIAVVAIEDDGDARVVIDALKARGILVNAVDRPADCDFTLPAIVDRSPILIAISTGGVSAGLAAAIRQRLEAILPAGVGRLAEGLGAARAALRSRFPEGGDRRRAIGAAIAAGGPLDPLVPHADDAVARWLADVAPVASRVETIRLRSADPDDLTLREARWLGQADRIHHAPHVPAAILDRARADAVRIIAPVPAAPLPGLTIDLA